MAGKLGSLAARGALAMLSMLAVVGLDAAASAAPPVLTQQGRLIDKASGKPATGTVSMKFTIFPTATGGTALWTETLSVTLDDGYFSARLGETTAIGATVFNGTVRYLEVAVDGDVMATREALTSVPYAMVAGNVLGDITPRTISVGGATVIDATGKWVGSPTGMTGPAGPAGPAGPPGSYTAGAGISITGTTLAVRPDSVVASMQGWPMGMSMGFMPTTPTAGACPTPAVGGNTFGAVTSTANMTVGTMFFDQSKMSTTFTRGRFGVTCRGNGVIELRSGFSCATVVATINCTSGTRPWTYVSAPFVPHVGSGEYDVQVRATSGTLDWADARLYLY